MKHTKQILMMLVIVFLLVGLTTLAATEVTQNNTNVNKNTDISKTGMINKDNTIQQAETINQKKQNQINKIQKENNKKQDTEATNIDNYDELANALGNGAESTKTLNITSDITLTDSLTINTDITKLTINGNQKTINGGGKYHFLTINNGQNVTINNLTITNCYIYGMGGAIVNEGNLSIDYSNLNYNTARFTGGAIDNNEGANLIITNSNLTHNTAEENSGGAIDNDANVSITNSNLNYNHAGWSGGAIYSYTDRIVTITDSNLTHNTASNVGAIQSWGNLTITGSNLSHNRGNDLAGAISNNNTCKISDTTFNNNTPGNFNITENNHIQLINANGFVSIGVFAIITDYHVYHGNGRNALEQYTIPSEATYVKLLLNGTNTTNNAFIIKGTPGLINIKNYGELANALLYDEESIKTLNITANIILEGNLNIYPGITKITLEGNQKTINGRGAFRFLTINDGQSVIINNLTITNCSAVDDGGAILNDGNLTISNSNLNYNRVNYYGGAICNIGGSNLTIINSNLTNNTGEYGGAIDNAGNTNIIRSNLNYNTARDQGGAICNYNNAIVNIDNSNLNGNDASYGGAVINAGNLKITSSNITHNKARTENGAIGNSGRYNISDTLFYNNTPDNFNINENNHIQLTNADGFVSIGDFTIITDIQICRGNGLEQLEQYTIPEEDANVKLLLNGTDTKDNTFVIKGNNEKINYAEVKITNENPTCGDTTDITATFMAEGSPVTGGMVIFRLNGKTLRNDDGKVIYVELNDGVATLENVAITNTWAGETTLQAIFTGNNEIEPTASEKILITVGKREAQIDIIAPESGQAGETIYLSANITAGEEPVTTGRVAFKLNGKTLKDTNGKALYANVENGVATITYTIPEKTKAKEYTLTAVFTDSATRQESNSLFLIKSV